jgi:hypothetical protein
MEGLAIKDTLKEMIRTILDDQPGQVPLGNVVMTWDGHTLSWDVPVREWDVDGVWESLRHQAEYHPEVEEIAFCLEALETLH